MRHKTLAALLFLISLAVLLLSLRTASLTTTFGVDTAYADQYFANFRELERNQSTAYRWTYSDSALMLPGFERLPLLVDLSLTSPRPADEPAADISLARGRWRMPAVPIQGDWRRYRFLLPASDYQPELSLISTMFRPDERDKRSLGVALNRVQLSVPALIEPLLGAALALAPWRIVLLLLYPLLLYTLTVRFMVRQRFSTIVPFVIACLGLIPVYLAAHDPLQAALIMPDAWRLPALSITLVLLWLALRPWLRPLERRALAALDDDRLRPIIVVSSACVLGMLMIFMVPAWEEQDEGAHFEYAWLIANRPTWPIPGTPSDPKLAMTNGQGKALHHQPLYYLLVSLALRLVRDLPIPQQLLVARAVSLMLFLGIGWSAERIASTLFPKRHILRWFGPLVVILNPTFANLMTSVNNDVGVTFVCSIAMFIATLILMQGLSWQKALMLLATVPIAVLVKNTGAVLLFIVPVIFWVSFWRQWRAPRWILLLPMVLAFLMLIFAVNWSDPAHWYRWQQAGAGSAMRISRPEAPLGPHVLRMDAVPIPGYEGLSSPLQDAEIVANHHVTVGAWVWASRPARIWAPGVLYQPRENEDRLSADHREIEVDTQPRWVASVYDIPPRILFVHLMAWSVAPNDTQPLEIYIDGAVMAIGEFPIDIPPQFTGRDAQQGIWGGKPFSNLIRNGDFEQGWFYLRPEVHQFLATYARRSPTRILASLADPFTTLSLELRDYIPWMMFVSFGAYGRIFLAEPIWQYLIPGTIIVAFLGLLWLGWHQRKRSDQTAFSCRVLGFLCLNVWGLILVAHLPVHFPAGIPTARYGFTVLIPTTLLLCGGWLALWPLAMRQKAALAMLTAVIMLDIAALSTIRLFENSACIREADRCIFKPIDPLQTQPLSMTVFLVLILVIVLVQWKTRTNPDWHPGAKHSH